MATAIGQSLTTGGDSTYLAGLLDAVGSWWNGLNPWQQIAVGAGIAALIALSGGSLGAAFGVSGIATYGLTKAHGAATFTRDPAAATTSYLTTPPPLAALPLWSLLPVRTSRPSIRISSGCTTSRRASASSTSSSRACR